MPSAERRTTRDRHPHGRRRRDVATTRHAPARTPRERPAIESVIMPPGPKSHRRRPRHRQPASRTEVPLASRTVGARSGGTCRASAGPTPSRKRPGRRLCSGEGRGTASVGPQRLPSKLSDLCGRPSTTPLPPRVANYRDPVRPDGHPRLATSRSDAIQRDAGVATHVPALATGQVQQRQRAKQREPTVGSPASGTERPPQPPFDARRQTRGFDSRHVPMRANTANNLGG